MSTPTPENPGECLAGEVFGGVLVSVVVVTNAISIILTWYIMKKRTGRRERYTNDARTSSNSFTQAGTTPAAAVNPIDEFGMDSDFSSVSGLGHEQSGQFHSRENIQIQESNNQESMSSENAHEKPNFHSNPTTPEAQNGDANMLENEQIYDEPEGLEKSAAEVPQPHIESNLRENKYESLKSDVVFRPPPSPKVLKPEEQETDYMQPNIRPPSREVSKEPQEQETDYLEPNVRPFVSPPSDEAHRATYVNQISLQEEEYEEFGNEPPSPPKRNKKRH